MTLIKDIMTDMEQGDRTKEQLLGMRMNEFNNIHRPNSNWSSNMGTISMTSTTLASYSIGGF